MASMKRIFTMLGIAVVLSIGATRLLAAEERTAGHISDTHGVESATEAAKSHSDEHGGKTPLLPTDLHEAKEYFLGPAIWTFVIFVIMLAILYPTAWKNVLA